VKRFILHPRFLLFLLIAVAAFVVSGCTTTSESDNASERPWNSPQGWETGGLPSGMNEGR